MSFKGFLKQSTAVTITVGPFVSSTDGVTTQTALTIAQADVRLSKNDGTFAQKNQASTCTHKENGDYSCSIDTTDTNTMGVLTVRITKSGALLWRGDYQVVQANVHNALFNNTNLLNINLFSMTTFSGGTTTSGVTSLAEGTKLQTVCTVTTAGFAGSSSQFETADITEATADHFLGREVYWTTGALTGQRATIGAYSLVSGRGRFTVTTMTDVPANGDIFMLI